MMRSLLDIFLSLVYYGGFYIAAFAFFCYAEKNYRGDKKRRGNSFMLLGILILSLFAALRSESVGTDVDVYARPVYNLATQSPTFQDLMNYYNNETGYYFLAYFCAHALKSFPAFLFFTEFLILLPIAICAVKNRKNVPCMLTMAIFMLLFYPMGFNVMRQSIAAAFLLLSLFLYFERKRVKSIIILFVAAQFHISVLLGALIFLVILGIVKIKSAVKRLTLVFTLSALFAVMFLFWSNIASWAIYEAHIIPQKYGLYLNTFENYLSSGTAVHSYFFDFGIYGIIDYIFRLSAFILPLSVCLKRKLNKPHIRFYIYSSFASLLLYTFIFFAFHTIYGYRITMYLDMLNIFYLGSLIIKTDFGTWSSIKRLPVSDLLLYGSLLFYWGLVYFILQAHAAVPYTFAI